MKIVAKKCILVPYEPCHVAKYHKWMENEEIRRLTGSEQLSLDEEYEMQKTWRNDEDKLTFIVLEMNESGEEVDHMLGDVNLFISTSPSTENPSDDVITGEVEVMIAEPRGRGKGIGEEAVRVIIAWAYENLKIEQFCVKITDDNTPSLSLFKKKLGFKQIGYSTAFKEFTFELPKNRLISEFSSFLEKNAEIKEYK